MPNEPAPTTVDEYIARCAPDVQVILSELRAVIHAAAPGVTEKISYGMMGFFLDDPLIWFGAWKRHIGLYPKTAALLAAIPELDEYKGTKGSIHFSLDRPMPYDLIRRIVEVRVTEVQ